jgi:ABC-type nickel/cobalt efflux system permease component RcnA
LTHTRARSLAAATLALVAALAMSCADASAHPLGNNSVNHLVYVKVFDNRVSLLYVLDQAEYPTLRDLRTGNPRQLYAGKLAEVRRRLTVSADGRPRPLEVNPGAGMRFRPGVGNLPTVRITIPLIARVRGARRVTVRDTTFPGQRGVALVVPLPARGTTVRRLDGPVNDPSQGLRLLPPGGQYADRTATLTVSPGAGTVVDARVDRPAEGFTRRGTDSGDAFTRLFERAAAGEGIFLVLLAAAFAWGALHALSPGHGKGMVAAYLVGTRGSARDALVLGAIVTVTHTAGVFALGLVTLALTQYVLPEDVYPWLNLVAGLLIVGVGLGVLRSRIAWGRRQREAAHAHPDAHGHSHAHGPVDTSRRGLVAMGVSAGLIPCPSALVVLLAALTQQRVGLGLVLIVAFSLGLAVTLTALGLAVVFGRRAGSRVPGARRLAASRVGAALPALSTLAILALGVVLTVRALPGVV